MKYVLVLFIIGCGLDESGLGRVDAEVQMKDGASLLPLGAQCATDDQCASAVCAVDPVTSTPSQCCSERPDSCHVCTNGQPTARADGVRCSAPGSTVMGLCDGHPATGAPSGSVATNYMCRAGTCTGESTDCTQRMCIGKGLACSGMCVGQAGGNTACTCNQMLDSTCL